MHTAALVLAVALSLAIIAIGLRFALAPRVAMAGYGIAADSPRATRALTEIKGARDVTSGLVMLAVWAGAGTTALGWGLIAVAVTPVADALIVRSNGGELSQALGIHGLTAVACLAAGLGLVLA